jgi:Carboxypeptidase regulatory-like domain
MNFRRGGKILRNTCIAWLLMLLAAGLAVAQGAAPSAGTGILRGTVSDPSGALLAEASVLLTTPSGGSMDTTTNKDGVYEFRDLPPGKYEVKAVVTGFALFDKPDVVITAGQVARLNIAMSIAVEKEKVEVSATSTQLDTSPANNANSIVLQAKDLEALSDDPDEMQSELQALAGPSAGPNGGQIYIDGFTAGQLPPKASIREIRINQNPFSAEYDKLGYGRIEIFTKPGTDSLHGQLMISGNDAAFNSRSPFEVLPEGTSPPGYHTTQFSGSIGGALTKKISFSFDGQRRDIEDLNIVNATVLDSNFNIVPFSAALDNPSSRTNISSRFDFQLTPSNTLTVRYQYWRDIETGDGPGGFSLAETASNQPSIEHTVQVTDTDTISPSTINELRFQYIRATSDTTPVSTAPGVTVTGAFVGNGSGGGAEHDDQNRYEVQDTVFKTFGKHSLKLGGRLRSDKDVNSTEQGFSGSFTFGSRQMPGCVVTPTNNCVISAIQAYQITEIGLSEGMTIPEIQALGGGASYFSQSAGTPSASVTLIDVGLFAQDDWKLRPNFTLSYGLRFEGQNNLGNKADWAPRVGFAWGIGGSAKNPPKTVLRGGFGMFYDRFLYNLVLEQERFNGITQQQYLVQNPTFFLNNIPPVNELPASTAPTVYQQNSNLHAPYTIQTGVTLERQLTKVANIAVTYLNSRGVHQFYTNDLNPADPVTGLRPDATAGNIFQYQSEGTFKENQVIVNGSVRMGTKLSLFGYYTLTYANSDTAGASTIPSNPNDLQEDYGRATFDVRNRVFFGGVVGLPKGFRVSPFMIASSGIPFNITTGSDPYQTNEFNQRPSFATCSSATQTKYGCFDASSLPGATPIPINYATSDGRFTLNMRVSKTFGFGPVKEGAAGGVPGGPGGGTFGRGPGGPRGGGGGRGGPDAGATNRRYALTLGASVRNIFNNVNAATPVGILGSPLFGESNALAGRPYSDATSNRRIDLQLTFAF